MARNADELLGGRGHLWRLLGWGGAVLLLLLPFAAMQFTREVRWTGRDFVVFGMMLLIAGATLEFTLRMSGTLVGKAASVVAIGTGFLLVWANLAVGIIGSEDNLANILFFGVILVAIAGGFVARLEPDRMVRAMAFTAAAQVLVTAMVVSVTAPDSASMTARELVANGGFVALWFLSAWLFRKGSRVASD